MSEESHYSEEDGEDGFDTDDSDVSLVRLKEKLMRRKDKMINEEMNEFIRQNMVITCHKCESAGIESRESFETFNQLRSHFKNYHDSFVYVLCCDQRWTNKTRLAKHLYHHKKTPSAQNPRRCLECSCLLKDERSYEKHMIIAHTPEEQKQFRCDRCAKAFATQDLLNSHLSWHEEVQKKNHRCETCGKYFQSARSLQSHKLIHLRDAEESSFAPTNTKKTAEDIAKEDELILKYATLGCPRCEYIGETFNKLLHHTSKEHDLSYAVTCCDRKFSERQRLVEHCWRHLNPEYFKCDICDKNYKERKSLQIHKWRVHTPISERPFKCDVCGDAFVKEYLLKTHMDRHLNKERKTHAPLETHQQNVPEPTTCKWICEVCAKGFTHRPSLERHSLTHTKEGLASLKKQCETCHKWLANRKYYLRHRSICGPANSGPAECDQCDHVSVNANALAVHKKLNHSNGPKFACRYCGREFKKQLRLKEHEANHEGISLYKCPYCSRECNSSSNMYKHKKKAHAEQWAQATAGRFSK